MPLGLEIDTLKTVTDTVHASSGEGSGWILHHVMDSRTMELPFIGEIHLPQFPLLFGIDISPTKFVVFMWLVAIILILLLMYVSKKY